MLSNQKQKNQGRTVLVFLLPHQPGSSRGIAKATVLSTVVPQRKAGARLLRVAGWIRASGAGREHIRNANACLNQTAYSVKASAAPPKYSAGPSEAPAAPTERSAAPSERSAGHYERSAGGLFGIRWQQIRIAGGKMAFPLLTLPTQKPAVLSSMAGFSMQF